jgi:methylenetetrahydrofolate dehydrogenase (NADP+) / methenyltetrahydrofolate cyclohydrolase
VTMAHSRSKDLPGICSKADILVAAVGRPEMVKADWVKPGATVIDVGINRVPAPEKGEGKTKLVGDCDYAACEPIAGAMLMANTVIAAYRKAGKKAPSF